MLVGIAFLLIYLCTQIVMALPSSPSNPESLNKIKEFHDNFVNNEIYDKQNSDIGQLKLPSGTIIFPWAPSQVSGLKSQTSFASTCPQKEKIILSGSQPEENVQDLKAMNAVKQRDIFYNESQQNNLESENSTNLMDVRVLGNPNNEDQNYDPDAIVDNTLIPDGQNAIDAKYSHSNYMNIEVSGITVNAINTVEDGSAVATSNIIIKPVQVIDSSSQASEKVQ